MSDSRPLGLAEAVGQPELADEPASPSQSTSAAGPRTVRMTRDSAGVITSVDDHVQEMLGWRPEQLVGSASTTLIHPEDQGSAVAAWIAMVTSPGTTHAWHGRYRNADGGWQWVETLNRLDPDLPFVSSSMTLVAAEQASMEDMLRAREQVLSRLSDALPVGVFQIDLIGRITFSNDRLHTMLGQAEAATIAAEMSCVVPDDRPALEAALTAVLTDQSIDDIEVRLDLSSAQVLVPDSERVCLLSLRTLTDSSGAVTGAVGCLSDVTDGVRLRNELEVRASVDELTSCLNRAAAVSLVSRAAAESAIAGAGLALIFIDLDHFKAVNDRYGHATGDLLLVAAVERLRGAVRDRDAIGRLGGDEFLVICPTVYTSEQAMMIAERISKAMTANIVIGRDEVELRASVGVAWTTEAVDADALIAQADKAMYESKRAGREGVSMFASLSLSSSSGAGSELE
jgi:diguanylate cyclase (GGDEF)-like protein/PAS domain S-box-containing protein